MSLTMTNYFKYSFKIYYYVPENACHCCGEVLVLTQTEHAGSKRSCPKCVKIYRCDRLPMIKMKTHHFGSPSMHIFIHNTIFHTGINDYKQ